MGRFTTGMERGGGGDGGLFLTWDVREYNIMETVMVMAGTYTHMVILPFLCPFRTLFI